MPTQHQRTHREPAQPAAPAEMAKGQPKVAVTVDARGFSPSRIEVEQGSDTTLEFTRTTDSTCARKVVFPDIGVEQELPLDQPVAIRIPTAENRTLTFQCGMGMYESAVVIN